MVNSILSAGGSPHNALLSHPDPLLEPHPFSGRSHGEFGFRVCEHGPQRDGERDKRFVEIRGVLHLSSYSLAFEAIANERHWMDHQSDRLPRQTRCKGMRIKREIQMGASGGGQSIKASGMAARTGRTQTCNRHDSPKPKTPLTRGGRPHNAPPAGSHANLSCTRQSMRCATFAKGRGPERQAHFGNDLVEAELNCQRPGEELRLLRVLRSL